MSLVGKKIEEFTVDAFCNYEFSQVSDKDFLGKWTVLAFYPADFSFVCPTELEDLQANYAALKELGAEVYSCSTDTQFVHAAWHMDSPGIGKIEYPMLADPAGKLARLFDVLDEEAGLAQRGTFIIDPEGVIQAVEITADGIGRNASQLIDKIKAAQFVRSHPGQVCPAKWKEGEATLTAGIENVGKL